MSEYCYDLKGKDARVKSGAHQELIKRDWARNISNHENEIGTILFEYDKEGPSNHICVEFKDEAIGYPPECIELI